MNEVFKAVLITYNKVLQPYHTVYTSVCGCVCVFVCVDSKKYPIHVLTCEETVSYGCVWMGERIFLFVCDIGENVNICE